MLIRYPDKCQRTKCQKIKCMITRTLTLNPYPRPHPNRYWSSSVPPLSVSLSLYLNTHKRSLYLYSLHTRTLYLSTYRHSLSLYTHFLFTSLSHYTHSLSLFLSEHTLAIYIQSLSIYSLSLSLSLYTNTVSFPL